MKKVCIRGAIVILAASFTLLAGCNRSQENTKQVADSQQEQKPTEIPATPIEVGVQQDGRPQLTIDLKPTPGQTAAVSKANKATPAATPATLPNSMIKNGSFEQDLSGWKSIGANLQKVSAAGAEGKGALEVATSANLFGGTLFNCENPKSANDELVLQGGKSYHVTAFIKGEKLWENVPVQIAVIAGTSGPLTSSRLVLNGQWQKMDLGFYLPKEQSVGLHIGKKGQAKQTTFLLDGVSLVSVD